MRTSLCLAALAVLVWAGAREDRYKELGQNQLDRFEKDDSDSARLRHLRKAVVYFKKADDAAGQVRALNLETGIYYKRKSLSLAEKRNAEALKLAPEDRDALKLRDAIRQAKEKDIFEEVDGIVGINRVQARRLATGVPLRDRGLARRR